jgi:hypothetical protein
VEYRVAVWADFSRAEFTMYVHAPSPGMALFSGTVDAERVTATKWTKAWYSDADLRIAVKDDATKALIAKNTTRDHPKTVVIPLDAGTPYRVTVWAKEAAADFAVCVVAP